MPDDDVGPQDTLCQYSGTYLVKDLDTSAGTTTVQMNLGKASSSTQDARPYGSHESTTARLSLGHIRPAGQHLGFVPKSFRTFMPTYLVSVRRSWLYHPLTGNGHLNHLQDRQDQDDSILWRRTTGPVMSLQDSKGTGLLSLPIAGEA